MKALDHAEQSIIEATERAEARDLAEGIVDGIREQVAGFNFNCPDCAGSIQGSFDTLKVTCPHCGSTFSLKTT